MRKRRQFIPAGNGDIKVFDEGAEEYLVTVGLPARNRDWESPKRREAQEICDGVFLGDISASKCQETLLKVGITDILIVRGPGEAPFLRCRFPECFSYQILETTSKDPNLILPLLPSAVEHIDAVISRRGRILVHGSCGMTKSAAIVCAFVMAKFNVSCEASQTHLFFRRQCISIPSEIISQLSEFEMFLRTRHRNLGEDEKLNPLGH